MGTISKPLKNSNAVYILAVLKNRLDNPEISKEGIKMISMELKL
jgi:hypothetical protein